MKPFKCSFCGRSFGSERAVADHARDNHAGRLAAIRKPRPAPVENEITEMWRELHAERAAKRAENRDGGAQVLQQAGHAFVSNNNGAHLIVAGGSVDFWPGTGLWMDRRTPERGRGVNSLLRHLGKASS